MVNGGKLVPSFPGSDFTRKGVGRRPLFRAILHMSAKALFSEHTNGFALALFGWGPLRILKTAVRKIFP